MDNNTNGNANGMNSNQYPVDNQNLMNNTMQSNGIPQQMPAQPMMGMQPQMPAQPMMGMQPQMPAQPMMGMQPQMPEQPMMGMQPQMQEQPMMGTQPQMPAQPMMGMQPQMPEQPMMNTQPQMPAQPMMNTQPQMPAQPTMGTQPVSGQNDEELLKAFIGEKYQKITTSSFNIPAFFFTFLYMLYRKMFLYSMGMFIINLIVLNVVNVFAVNLVFNILMGIFMNKIYLFYANNKIKKIKEQNQDKNPAELMAICARKGGTSVGLVCIGFIIDIVIAFLIMIVVVTLQFGKEISKIKDQVNKQNGGVITENQKNEPGESDTYLEDVNLSGYMCMLSTCKVTISNGTNETTYQYNAPNSELFVELDEYSEYVKINIYVSGTGEEQKINAYELYSKTTNEDLTDVTTIEELNTRLGISSPSI